MKKLLVRYRGWGENWPLGQLADDGHQLLFEYSKEALREGLELSPVRLPQMCIRDRWNALGTTERR